MYSDKIFPRPFPPVCQFFHPFLRLAPPPLSLFFADRLLFSCPSHRRQIPFCPFPPPHQLSGTVQAIAFPTFLYCAGVFFFALSYLPPPSLFSCPPPPDFPVLCRRCPVYHNFPVFFDGIVKKAGYVLLFFGQHQRGGQCLRHCPPLCCLRPIENFAEIFPKIY